MKNTIHGIDWHTMVKYDPDFNIRDKKLPKKLGEEKQKLFIKMCLTNNYDRI